MHTSALPHRLLAALLQPLLLALLLAMPALAASAAAEATYRDDRAACMAAGAPQSRSDCLREAGAARAEAGRGGLKTPTPQALAENAKRRCAVHTDPLVRTSCERMAAGEGSVSGSVDGGGTLKSLTVTVPAAGASAPKPAN
jgi:hypothetical protein